MKNAVPDLYHKYFIDRNFERLDLFQLLAEKYKLERALYPGSFVHVTPSFVIPDVVYIDSDRRAEKFFVDPGTYEFVARRKKYLQDAKITFKFADYRYGIDEREGSFDLLISQYAGFVGLHCKRYLKKGGLLLANNSHGDAGVAAIDKDYQLIAVPHLQNGKHRISEDKLEDYFVPKSSKNEITKEYLVGLQKGIGYKKSASAYVYRKLI